MIERRLVISSQLQLDIQQCLDMAVEYQVVSYQDSGLSHIVMIKPIEAGSGNMIVLRGVKGQGSGHNQGDVPVRQVQYALSAFNNTLAHAHCYGSLKYQIFEDIACSAWIVEEYINGSTLGAMFDVNAIDDTDGQIRNQLADYCVAGWPGCQRSIAQANCCINEMIVDFDGAVNTIDMYRKDTRLQKEIAAYEPVLIKEANRLKQMNPSLVCVQHGDFHPWNIIFNDSKLRVIDRSRSIINHAVQDFACLAINAISKSYTTSSPQLSHWCDSLIDLLNLRLDQCPHKPELLQAFPYFALARIPGLVSPVFYPEISLHTRKAHYSAAVNILEGVGEFRSLRDFAHAFLQRMES